MDSSSFSLLPTPSPAIHLVVSQGGSLHEATLVDPCVLYLLKQKREEGMFLSSCLGDLLAPRMGVKILWSATNQTEIVEASAIRIVQGHNWQQGIPGGSMSMSQSSRNEESSLLTERKRLISTLRDSSSLATEALRKQFMPQSLGVLPPQAFASDNMNMWNNETSNNKRRKLSNYSSWLQERCKSISPETITGAPMGAAALANMNPLSVSMSDELQNFQGEVKLNPRNRRVSDISHSSMAAAAAKAGSRTSDLSKGLGLSEDDAFLQHMLSAKRASQRSGIAARPFGPKDPLFGAKDPLFGAKQQPVSVPTKPAPKTTSSAAASVDPTKSWEHMYDRLLKHMEERGIDKVPTRISTDPELRNWVAQQRLDFKKRNLNSERQFLLRSVGFHRDKFTLKWDAKFERLKDFKKEHGHTNVPFHYAKDRQLGTWVSKQRVRIRQGTISEEEKTRLEAIGFVPNRFNARWEEMFRRLVAYKKIYGDANVPRVYEKDPQLAQWVLNQKDAFREGKMKPDRQIKLEAIGFSWSTFYEGDLEWEGNFQKLLAHKEMNGHVRFFKDPKLARWVALQQSLHSMGTLNPQRMNLLIQIGVLPAHRGGGAGAAATVTSTTTTTTMSSAMASLPRALSSSSSSMSMPPMGLRQSFSEWSSTGNNSTFL